MKKMHTVRLLPLFAVGLLMVASVAYAAVSPVGLGTAGNFAILAGSTITNIGPSIVSGNVGLSPGTSVTGFPPGLVNGTMHVTDSAAAQAQADLVTAYNDAAGRTPSIVPTELGGTTKNCRRLYFGRG